MQHCASEIDCTSDDDFCACCREYGRQTEWSEACVALCDDGAFTLLPTQSRWISQEASWRMDDFGRSQLPPVQPPPSGATINTATWPYFEQPALSLVGDAAVVLGDCYELELRSSQMLDRAGNMVGTEACLLPPVTRKLFDSDSHLHLNLGVCPSALAPFHVHDTQPGAVAAMLCFDECHVRNHSTPTPLQPEVRCQIGFVNAMSRSEAPSQLVEQRFLAISSARRLGVADGSWRPLHRQLHATMLHLVRPTRRKQLLRRLRIK